MSGIGCARVTRSPGGLFLCVTALLFGASAVITIAWCASMSAAHGMPMPGGWTMSMAWMRMPAQTWSGAAASFIGMWVVMMVAMMLPSLAPILWRYHQTITRTAARRPGRLTITAGAGYFAVWTVVGFAAFLAGVTVTAFQMRHPAVARATPIVAGAVVLAAGTLQFTAWKARHLACWRAWSVHGAVHSHDARAAWRHGVRLGLCCARCCGNLMAIFLVVGMMDLPAMAVVTIAITLERVVSPGARVERVIGAVALAAATMPIAQVAGLP